MRITASIRFLLFALVIVALSATSFAQFGITVSFGPPALPIYEQPPCPAEGYLWTPGYWAYAEDGGYYWVPGTWVMAPQPGLLWTPPYWGWEGGRYAFYQGYWGPRVGFYGGIAYGYGYFGDGYQGGRWEHDRFYYNRSVNNVNVTNIHNVYNTTVINNTTINRVSYNGGNGGVERRASAEELAAARERHVAPVAAQNQHMEAARSNPQLRASANEGKPPIAATVKPGAFSEREAVPAKEAGAPYKAGANRGAEAPKAETADRPANNVPKPPSAGGAEPKAETAARPENNGNKPSAARAEEPKTETPAARAENNVPKPPAATHAKDLQPHPRPAPPSTGNAKTDQKYQQQQTKLYTRQDQEHQRLQQKQEQEHQRLAQKPNEVKTQQVEQKHQQQTQQMEQKHGSQEQHLQSKQQPANHAPNPPKEAH